MRFITLKNTSIFCFILLLLFSCDKNKAKKGISEENFKSIMIDLFLIQGTYDYQQGSIYNDSTKNALDSIFNLVYKKHHTDSTIFKESWDYYLSDKNNYLSLMSAIRDSIQKFDSVAQLRPINKDEETASYGASMEKEEQLFEQQFRGRKNLNRIRDSILKQEKIKP
ncbi:MAG TPA: DUF4296 domain-containing protein [Chitinophagales bacterium]|nr:DUF4296 domain-containing protein [Chitinophagales bacterium]HMW94383.1 DUF4296 domain-containing protein [Chitinophagales bacterium]HMY42249.1 DUF4296 domain-containing protein [Chitinophagales bacterium]HMZ94035.1 DUF4296 domain-containing protein [Chitinophagales bacterium]HNC64698.1 DUF4296 domain-containing protein [Chitinophagales bacterium]